MPLSFYAFLRPAPSCPRAHRLREAAKKILSRIEDGKEVATTIVHVVEAANIPRVASHSAHLARLCRDYTITVERNSGEHTCTMWTLKPIVGPWIARRYVVGVDDALAAVCTRRLGISEVHCFDRDFDKDLRAYAVCVIKR